MQGLHDDFQPCRRLLARLVDFAKFMAGKGLFTEKE